MPAYQVSIKKELFSRLRPQMQEDLQISDQNPMS